MGGCYESSRSSCRSYSEPVRDDFTTLGRRFFSATKSQSLSDLIGAWQAVSGSGIIGKLLALRGLKETPKEFPEIEYEVKFDLMALPPSLKSKSKKVSDEPDIQAYLDAFVFPVQPDARFLKDPVNALSVGTNHFYGRGEEELLVVIEKGGKLYLKEKSLPLEISCNVPLADQLVVKRTEDRYASTFSDAMAAVGDVLRQGASYAGALVKEKGDAFILDTHDGRIYSFTITRAQVRGVSDAPVQRQLEIEYAGYIPGFAGFVQDNEAQLVAGMVDLGRYVGVLHASAPLGSSWRLQTHFTRERKWDFVSRALPGVPVTLDLLPASRELVPVERR